MSGQVNAVERIWGSDEKPILMLRRGPYSVTVMGHRVMGLWFRFDEEGSDKVITFPSLDDLEREINCPMRTRRAATFLAAAFNWCHGKGAEEPQAISGGGARYSPPNPPEILMT
jgi:hypothetical protein